MVMADLEKIVEELDTRLPRATTEMIRFIRDCPSDVTLPQAFLLQYIKTHGACTASTIGEIMGVTSGPVTGITQRLIQRGLLERRQDETDRRVVWFSLTKEGEAVVEASVRNRRQKWHQLFRRIGTEKAELLLSLVIDIEAELKQIRRGGVQG
jgi:DNA-binding MarR family transcriptional regulator